MKQSVVWYYQELARRVGPERMQKWVTAFRYGNEDISGGIDRFWLESALRISRSSRSPSSAASTPASCPYRRGRSRS